MTQPSSAVSFQTTNWSMVVAACADPEALERLLRTYWGPIYVYIRRTGASREQAADLTQEFVVQVLLERGLIERADPDRGRFRTFLKSALRRFLIDQHRRSTSKARHPGVPILNGDALDALEPTREDDPGRAFDRQWAATLISQALDRTAAECAAEGQSAHWEAFNSAILEPTLRHTHSAPFDELAKALGVGGPERVSAMIQTMRRKFRRALREAVAQTVCDPSHTDLELENLKSLLGL
jgi:RNA polymerase sigma factor (sigma-70 family)